jgi:hypothetical protein
VGEVPWWYVYFRLSQAFPAVKPWEWAEAPLFWRDAAIAAMNAQASAEEQISRASNRRRSA